jgi:hypothetical protein
MRTWPALIVSVAPQPDAGSSAGPDAGAMEPRTDNLDPWSR